MLTGIISFLIGFGVVYLSLAFRHTPAPFEWVIEVNIPGQPTIKKRWEPGIHFLWIPIRPFMFVKSKMPMDRQTVIARVGQEEGEGTSGKIELEDASAAIIMQIIFKIIDPIKATYEIDNYRSAVINKVEALTRQFFGGKKLDEALKHETKADVIEKVTRDAAVLMAGWGVELIDVAIIDFVLDEETDKKRREILNATKDADAEAIRADGSRRAKIENAKGDGEAIKIRAQAEKFQQILLGEGEGGRISIIAREAGVSPQEVMAFIRSPEYFEALKGTTIYSFSEGGGLNFPAGMAAILNAFTQGMSSGKGGSTT